jgi:hypothetical protein
MVLKQEKQQCRRHYDVDDKIFLKKSLEQPEHKQLAACNISVPVISLGLVYFVFKPTMLKLAQKRPREWTEDMNITPMPCSPRRVLTLSNNNNNSPKKLRDFGEFGQSIPQQQQRSPIRSESPFNSTNVENPAPTEVELDQAISRRNRNKNTNPQMSEMLFTYDQVREIVNRVVAEKEQQLRAEYDQILQQQLQEQYRNFAKFNEDYISRQLKQSDFSYLS